jgi:hypothetical protein
MLCGQQSPSLIVGRWNQSRPHLELPFRTILNGVNLKWFRRPPATPCRTLSFGMAGRLFYFQSCRFDLSILDDRQF